MRGTAETDENMSIPLEGDSQGSQSVESVQQTESIQTEDNSIGTQEQPESNPFWGEVEKLTGPNVYKLIQPHLAKADTEARKRVEAVNEQYAQWKTFADQGISPQHVQDAFGIVGQLNDPQGQVQIYESLRTFLEREGRLPSNAELAQEVQDGEGADAEDPRDAQIKALADRQAQIDQFFADQQAQQQWAVQTQQADQWLGTEISKVQQSHPEFDRQDLNRIVEFAIFQQTQTGQEPQSLDAATAAFIAERDRIRSTPRPTDSAPRIPSGPGGTPGSSISEDALSKQQRIDLVTSRLQAGRQ